MSCPREVRLYIRGLRVTSKAASKRNGICLLREGGWWPGRNRRCVKMRQSGRRTEPLLMQGCPDALSHPSLSS